MIHQGDPLAHELGWLSETSREAAEALCRASDVWETYMAADTSTIVAELSACEHAELVALSCLKAHLAAVKLYYRRLSAISGDPLATLSFIEHRSVIEGVIGHLEEQWRRRWSSKDPGNS